MIKTKIYFHRSKEANWDLANELELPDSVMDKLRYMGYEIELDVEIDPETGHTVATHLDGHELATKVTLT